MSDLPRKQPAADVPVVPVHEEPTSGGSYTRNPITGQLTKNEPVLDDQPNQE